MTVIVYPHNVQEERVLLEFLETRGHVYQVRQEHADESEVEFMNAYNNDLDKAEIEIKTGCYLSNEDIDKFFSAKRTLPR